MMMKVLGRKLFFMAAATAMWLAAIQPGVLSAQTSGVGGDGFTRLLWRGTNGSISLWKLDGNLNEMGVHVYGPFPDYDPIAITAAANSYTYVLWRNTDNSISLWGVYPALNLAFYKAYGPYPCFIAETLSADTNGNSTLRLVWRNTNGQADVWFLDNNLNYIRSQVYTNSFGFNPGPASAAAVKAATPGTADPQAAAAMNKNTAVQQSMPS
jgi:hypothetical protein